MPVLRPTSRTAVAFATLALLGPFGVAAAQSDAPPFVRVCRAESVPARLPPVAQVVDSARLAPALARGELAAMAVSLSFDRRGSLSRLAVLESELPPAATDSVRAALAAAIRPQRRGDPWGARLLVGTGPATSLAFERAVVCPPVLQSAPAVRTVTVPALPGHPSVVRAAAFRVTVDAEGRVVDVRLVRSGGASEFDRAQEDAIRRRTYLPGLRDGAPAEMTIGPEP